MNRGTAAVGRLVALRHARSAWNAEGRFTGSVDVGLAANGQDEITAAARLLAGSGLVPDLVVTSSLRRSVETAELLAVECRWSRARVVSTPNLDERHHGVLEGLTLGEAEHRFGEDEVRTWRRSAHAGPPAGESFDDVVNRVRTCWAEVVEPAVRAGEDVLVVGHGTSLRALLVVAGGCSAETASRTEIGTARPLDILWAARSGRQ